MNKQECINKIQLVLNNYGISDKVTDFSDEFYCEINEELSVKILIEIQNKLLDFEIILCGSCSPAMNMWFKLIK